MISSLRLRSAFGRALTSGPFLLVLGSCKSDGTSEPTPNPLPVLASVAPAQLVIGSSATTVILTGSGFVGKSQARWNDGDRITHYQNAQTLMVDLPASDLAILATGKFTVVNGAPGGGTSGVVNVVVGNPAPTLTSVTPNSTAALSPSSAPLPITIAGSGFTTESIIFIGTNALVPSSVTSRSSLPRRRTLI